MNAPLNKEDIGNKNDELLVTSKEFCRLTQTIREEVVAIFNAVQQRIGSSGTSCKWHLTDILNYLKDSDRRLPKKRNIVIPILEKRISEIRSNVKDTTSEHVRDTSPAHESLWDA